MHKHIRTLFAASFLCSVASALTLSACDAPNDGATPESQPTLLTPAQLGLGDGWTEQEQGLWSRIGADGVEEFVGVGAPGKLHGLASLYAAEEQLAIAAEVEGADKEKTQAQLAEIRALIVDIENTEIVNPTHEQSFRCEAQLTHNASAGPGSCNAVQANASVTYNNYCNTVQESIYTYTSATCGVVTTTHSCGWKTGTNVSCSSSSTLSSATDSCNSYAYATSNYYSTWKDNTVKGYCEPPVTCGPCPGNYDCHCGEWEGCIPRNQLCR